MRRIILVVLVFVVGHCASAPLFAQINPNVEAGLKPYGSYDSNDFDTVSLSNLNLFVHIPLIAYPQRGSLVWQTYVVYNGKNFYTALTCNSHTDTCTARWIWGNQRVSGTPGVYLINRDAVNVHYQFVSPNNWATVYTWDGSGHETGHLSDGTQAPFDGSGLRIDTSSYIQNSVGDRIGFTDTNGNLFSLGTNSVQDTMARSLPVGGTSTTDYTGCTGPLSTTSATITNYPGYNGGSVQVKTCYANGTLKTAFNARITDQYGNRDLVQELQGTGPFLQTVIVYDGSSWATSPRWSFTFDAGLPGDTNVHYGDLLSVTLPTGGTISYTWTTTGTCGSQLSPTSRGVTSRTVNANDGLGPQTTSYSAAAPGLVQTDPLGNDTVHVITGLNHTCSLYETETDYYQGSYTLGNWVKKVTTQYQYQADPFDGIGDGTQTETGVFPTQITTVFPNGQQSQVQKSYDSNLTATAPYGSLGGTMSYTMSYGKNLEDRDYDYGTPGPLLRRTDYTYLAFNNSSYLAANMLDRIASETIYNGTAAQVAQTTYGYDEYGLQTTSTPQHGAPPYSVRGNRTSLKRWLNTTGGTLNTTTTYFDTGMPYQVTDPKANVTTYTYSGTYDGAYVTQTTMPATGSVQHVVSATYDFNTGKMATFTDQNGQPFSYGYDALWRPTSASYPDTGQTTLSYPTLTEIVTTEKMATSQNKVSTLIFDGLGRTKQTQLNSDPDGIDYTDTTYDGDGQIHTVSNPYRSTGDPTYGITTYLYDPVNRGCLIAPPDATPPSGTTCPTTQPADTVFTVYSGNSTTVTDEQGKTRESFTDGLGRLTSVIENPGGLAYSTTYGYDALDNLTSAVQNSSRNRTFVYDSLSRLTSATNPESGATSYTYDADDNVATRIDARNITTTYFYDSLNRLTSKTYSDGTPTAYFYYDLTAPWGWQTLNTTGRLSTEQNAQGGSAFSYDAMGRVTHRGQCGPLTCGWSGYDVLVTYNLLGGPTSINEAQQAVTLSQSFNAAELPTQITSSLVDSQHPATLVSGVHYNASGGVTSYLLGNNLTETATYNGRVQPCRMNVNSSGTLLGSCTASVPSGNLLDLTTGFNYGSGDNGNVMSWAAGGQQIFNRSYTYDGVNRLYTMSAPGSTCSGLSWSYDEWGNRTAQNVTGGTCSSAQFTFNTSNHATNPGFLYDAAGNLVNDGVHSYTYDAENRITKIDAGATASYAYDAAGNRVEKVVGAAKTDYIYDAANRVMMEVNQSLAWQAGYVYLGGQLVAEYENGTTYFVHGDHLGSTRLLTNLSGGVVDSMDYLPFGEQIAGASATTHKFTGQERESEVTLDNFQARYYSFIMGRFISPDWSAKPQGVPYADFGNPQSLNLYSYVKNNPTTTPDSDGHDPDDAYMVLAGAEALAPEATPLIVGAAVGVAIYENRDAISQAVQSVGSAVSNVFHSSDTNKTAPAAPAATPTSDQEVPTQAPGFIGDAGGNVAPIPTGSTARPADNGNGVVYQPPVPAGAHPDANAVRVMGPTATQPTGSITVHGPTGQPINPATGKPDTRANTHTPIVPVAPKPCPSKGSGCSQ